MKLEIFSRKISVCYDVYRDCFHVIFDDGFLHKGNSTKQFGGGSTYKIITMSAGFYSLEIKKQMSDIFVFPEIQLMNNHWFKSAREFLFNNSHFLDAVNELKKYFEPTDPGHEISVYQNKFVTAEISSLFDLGYFE